MRHVVIWLTLTALLWVTALEAADDPVFSGPQVGEKLAPFKVKGVYGEEAGKQIDFVSRANGKPLFLIFAHQRTRPAFGLLRALTGYAAKRKVENLTIGVVWLTDDATATESWLKRIKTYMPEGPSTTLSLDGAEGPGAYGLNRKVTLTVLIADKNKVTANFALVQPSLKADGPRIARELVKVIGGKAPTAKELGGERYNNQKKRKPKTRGPSPELQTLLRGLINKDATPEEVDKQAAAIEEYFKKNRQAPAQVGQIARRIIDAGRLKTYGTPKAQEYLTKWAEKYAPKDEKKTDKDGAKKSKRSEP